MVLMVVRLLLADDRSGKLMPATALSSVGERDEVSWSTSSTFSTVEAYGRLLVVDIDGADINASLLDGSAKRRREYFTNPIIVTSTAIYFGF